MLKRRFNKKRQVTFRKKSSSKKSSSKKRYSKKRSSKKNKTKRRSGKKHYKKQRGGGLEPFKESDFGVYDFDEYYEVEPEQNNIEDEGYEPDENSPILEYNNVVYPIYTDIDELDEYIMMNDDEGTPVMVKTSAVKRVMRNQ